MPTAAGAGLTSGWRRLASLPALIAKCAPTAEALRPPAESSRVCCRTWCSRKDDVREMGSTFCPRIIIKSRKMPSRLRRLNIPRDVEENNVLIPDLCHSSGLPAQLLAMSEPVAVGLVIINMLPRDTATVSCVCWLQ